LSRFFSTSISSTHSHSGLPFCNFVRLQYNVALDAANAQVNPGLSLVISEKFRAVKSGGDAWAFLCPDFTASISVTHNQLGVYSLTGGVYLLHNSTRSVLHYLILPGREGEEGYWVL